MGSGFQGVSVEAKLQAEECVTDEQGGLTNGLGGIRRQVSLSEEQRKCHLFR